MAANEGMHIGDLKRTERELLANIQGDRRLSKQQKAFASEIVTKRFQYEIEKAYQIQRFNAVKK